MLKILLCVWSVAHLKTIWNFLLTSSVLEGGLLLSELSGVQFQDMVFQSRTVQLKAVSGWFLGCPVLSKDAEVYSSHFGGAFLPESSRQVEICSKQ